MTGNYTLTYMFIRSVSTTHADQRFKVWHIIMCPEILCELEQVLIPILFPTLSYS